MRKKTVSFILAAFLLMSILTGCGAKKTAEANAPVEEKYIPVEIATVVQKTISNETTFSGKIYADKEVYVVPKTPGKVMSVNVAVGSVVKKGTVLFQLDKEDIQKQADLTKKSIDLAEANYQLTREKIDNAKVTLERTRALYEQGAIPKSQLEQAELAASDTSLQTIQVQLEQAQLQYTQALDSLQNLTITAPVDGIVSAVDVEVGEMASTAQPSVTIVNMDNVYAEINVTENVINAITVGKEVVVDIPSASSESLTGKIDKISPVSDAKTQLYPIRIYIENQNHLVKPGMFAKVKLSTNARENVIAVPTEAIMNENDKNIVYVVADDRAAAREVGIGLEAGGETEIVKGLKPGEKVIVKGQDYVEDESKVKVVRGEQ
ncbi:RND family efflux transporter MFP subunit [Anaerosolibacter carboniphilus]|uniref:RND family efflux transporter MFP subunit n=1 Tax=Anaerosolibacter carboniphilus TaxID=1417629 RepID=A0A841KUM3_9FIRM|nr:efflux RND transporter periplasmic adaptor subunit [Anaerosolibacter carboniphilus]MBB6214622.1 RND family efflux transporter MFP subunit [Anaerosolibacter carboniphilus]